jgi:ferredoxin
LAAAYFLARLGHRCTVFDEHDRPGGALLQLAAEGRLPAKVIESDLAVLEGLGILWRNRSEITGEDLRALRGTYEALVLAPGSPQRLARLVPGERFDRLTAAGATAGVFACGNATRTQPSFLAVQAVADGRRAALSAAAFLAGLPVVPERRRFDSHLAPESAQAFALLARGTTGNGQAAGTEPASSAEALRCLRCDCAAKSSCGLRELSGRYGAEARHFAGEERTPPRRTTAAAVDSTGRISFEPGKCIKCGICVRIAERAGERPGLAFSGRGYAAEVRVPFDADLGQALGASAREAARRCPTGALVWEGRAPEASGLRARTQMQEQAQTRAQKGKQS